MQRRYDMHADEVRHACRGGTTCMQRRCDMHAQIHTSQCTILMLAFVWIRVRACQTSSGLAPTLLSWQYVVCVWPAPWLGGGSPASPGVGTQTLVYRTGTGDEHLDCARWYHLVYAVTSQALRGVQICQLVMAKQNVNKKLRNKVILHATMKLTTALSYV